MQKVTPKTFRPYWLLWILFSLFAFACSSPQVKSPEKIILSNARLYSPDTAISITTKLPATVYDALETAGVIPNPYVGENEEKVQWVSEKEWVYEMEFEVTKDFIDNKNIFLKAEQLDTYGKVLLNGKEIGTYKSAFQPYENHKIKQHLKEGINRLEFHFYPIDSIEEAKQEAYGMKLPDGTRMHSRKAQFQYGWDWGMKMKDMGIADFVSINAFEDFYIDHTTVSTDSIKNDTAYMTLYWQSSTDIRGNDLKVYHLEKEMQRHFPDGFYTNRSSFVIPHPKLWMPHTDGEANMYSEIFTFKNSKGVHINKMVKFGIRDVKLNQDSLRTGTRFQFHINGKEIFAQGANIIPSDHRYSRMSDDDLRQLVDDAKAANMNMLRVWGGGFYLPNSFYAYCDEQGIMVWQDFMFACAMYPGDQEFTSQTIGEAIYQVSRLRAHPSVVLWCGNNEISEGWQRWGWSTPYSKEDSTHIADTYSALFQQILPGLVGDLGFKTPYWESSPSLGRGNPNYIYSGDAHNWWVWHDGAPFSNFEEQIPRFMSEFGFQSFPSLASMDSMSEGSWPTKKELAAHQKHSRGFAIIDAYWKRNLPPAKTKEDTIYLTQVLQALGMEKGMRTHKTDEHCGGSLYWQLNDCWPAISWSSIDYYGYWKAMHYRAKKAFDKNVFRVEMKSDSLQVYAFMDDAPKGYVLLEHRCQNEYYVYQHIYSIQDSFNIKGQLFSIAIPKKVKNRSTKNSYWKVSYIVDKEVKSILYSPQVFWKDLDLKSNKLDWKLSADGKSVEITASAFNAFVNIQTPFKKIEDNFFHIEAGGKRVIKFPEAVKKEDIKVISLNNY